MPLKWRLAGGSIVPRFYAYCALRISYNSLLQKVNMTSKIKQDVPEIH